MSSERILKRLKTIRGPALWTVQAGIFAVSGIIAFFIRFDLSFPGEEVAHLVYALPIWIVAKLFAFRIARLDRPSWRFVSLNDLPRLIIGNLLGSVFGTFLILWLAPRGFPRSIYIIDMLICLLLTIGARVVARILFETSKLPMAAKTKRILIYGAGQAGVSLVKEIRHNAGLNYNVIGFIDDDPMKAGLVIHGVNVLGNGQKLVAAVRKHQVDTILIAIPSASGYEITLILQRCQEVGVLYKTVPGLGEIIKGNGLAKQIRDVSVEDLLGRSPAQLEEEEVAKKLDGKIVFVTGAGGSIGSELCRQIACFRPEAIVGYEISENAAFHLDLYMKEHFPKVAFYPEIGSVQKPERLAEVLKLYRPSILYHAAAYKHVPMMEAHMFEALENNVFGTYETALAAEEHEVEDFVMISTDKAVRPTSIMGVSKRLAELTVNSLQNGGIRFVSVRFGNVLESNGSVIPLFKKQIAAGGPVRVTHPEMRRYFMTIPEASQLVLQASTMGKGGEIFVLDMGEPVKIIDLARNLILLSGLRPDKDIRIEFTGIRPGEKLYEEMHTLEEFTLPTRHRKIKIFAGSSLRYGEMTGPIETLRQICAVRDVTQLILHLKEVVPEYNPSSYVLRRAFLTEKAQEPQKPLALAAAERWSAKSA